MTIGFVVSFFDFRNDVRKVIEMISADNNVIVFYKESDQEKVLSHRIRNIEYRPIRERKRTIKNLLAERLFIYLKKLPASRHNYFLMELLKISNIKSKKVKQEAEFVYKMQKLLPRMVSYDQLLNWLTPLNKSKIDDIDRFFFFTEIADDYLLSRLIREKKDLLTYVYSWDHPCKHTRFSKNVKYLCWSEGIKEDLVKLQEIDPVNITISSATQFGYVFEFLNSRISVIERTYPFEYIYFGCAIGIKELVIQEIQVIKELAAITYATRPHLKFVVRPYPILESWELYETLKQLPNIVLDDGFRNKDFSVDEDNIYSKFEKISNAKAFLHMGTTMGLEASFTNSNSFIVDFGYEQVKGLSLKPFIYQYQNEKYIINAHPKAAINSPQHWKALLETDFYGCEDLNRSISSSFHVNSFEAIAYGFLGEVKPKQKVVRNTHLK